MLKVKVNNTVNGIVSISVGTIETRATNQDCRMNSRQANGGLNIATKVSSAIAKKPPTARTGLVTMLEATTSSCLSTQQSRCLRRCCESGHHPTTPLTVHHRFPAQQQDRARGDIPPRKAYERLLPGRYLDVITVKYKITKR